MLDRLRRRCQRDHVHQQLVSGRANAAENYPLELVVEILRGMRDTADKRMHFDNGDTEASNLIALSPGYCISDVCVDSRVHHAEHINNVLASKNANA